MTTTGTANFVSFTKACDYYRNQGNDELTPAALESLVRAKIGDGEIEIGKPDLKVGDRLLVIDGGTRYATERKD
jgi:hypothetical protein